MLISASASLPVAKQDLSSAVRQIFELVQQQTSHQKQTGISASLAVDRDFRFLRALAEALPDDAPGFSFFALGGKIQMFTAREFLEKLEEVQIVRPSRRDDPIELIRTLTHPNAAVMATYQGRLTDHRSYEDVKQLLLRLIDTFADAQQRVTIGLTLDRVEWKGLTSSAVGTLTLSDHKENRQKTRFRIYASLECKGNSPKEASVRQIVQQVAGQTQLAFDSDKLYARPDPEDPPTCTPEERFPIQMAFQEALAQAKEEIGALQLQWRNLAGLHMDGIGLRIDTPESVPMPSLRPNALVRAWMKTRFPGWKSVKPQDEWLRFRSSLDENLDMLLTFEFDRMSRDRAFTLHFGILIKTGKMQGWLWKVPLFELFGRSAFMPCWSFGTLEELEAALPALGDLVHSVLPSLEAQVRHWLSPLPTEINGVVLQRGPVTAQEAYQEALTYAQVWYPGAKLSIVAIGNHSIGAFGTPNRYPMVDSIISGMDEKGRLNQLGYWRFRFSGLPGEDYDVVIPSVGSPRWGACTNHYSQPGTLNEGWIDSDEVIRIAEKNGGYEALQQATRCYRRHCNLRTGSRNIPNPHWEVSYQLVSDRGRNDFYIAIDAFTGEPLGIR